MIMITLFIRSSGIKMDKNVPMEIMSVPIAIDQDTGSSGMKMVIRNVQDLTLMEKKQAIGLTGTSTERECVMEIMPMMKKKEDGNHGGMTDNYMKKVTIKT